MPFCGSQSLAKFGGNRLQVSPLRCKTWACPDCGPRRAADLRWLARRGSPNIFLTLTIRKGVYETPQATAVELAKGWRMLRQYLCRLLGRKSIPFLAVIEQHKSGWPHMHLLLRTDFIDHRLIREWWQGRFNSPMIWIERLENDRKAAFYVSKYMAKKPTAFEGCKRYWRSQDYENKALRPPKPDRDEDVYFEVMMAPVESVMHYAIRDGARVTFDGFRAVIEHWHVLDMRRWGIQGRKGRGV